jgi:hypothetical protein
VKDDAGAAELAGREVAGQVDVHDRAVDLLGEAVECEGGGEIYSIPEGQARNWR